MSLRPSLIGTTREFLASKSLLAFDTHVSHLTILNRHFFHRTSSMTASDSEPINHHLSIMAAARDAHLAASTRDSEAASAPN